MTRGAQAQARPRPIGFAPVRSVACAAYAAALAGCVPDALPRIVAGGAADAGEDAADASCEPVFPAPDLPSGRSLPSVASTPDGTLYVVGGQGEVTKAKDALARGPCDAQWRTIAPIPTPRVGAAAVVAPDGRIYVLGGLAAPGNLATVEVYDPALDSWLAAPPMPTPRALLGAAIGGDGRLYAVGGLGPGNAVVSTVEAFDFEAESWSSVAPLHRARSYVAAMSTPDGRVYAIGGGNYGCDTYDDVEAFDPAANAWSIRASLPKPLSEHAGAAGSDGRLYVVGGDSLGCMSQASAALLQYDPDDDAWTELDPIPTPREQLAVTADGATGGIVYALGGAGADGAALSVEAFDVAAGHWLLP